MILPVLAVTDRCGLDGVTFTMGLDARGLVVDGDIVISFGGLVELVGLAPHAYLVNPLCSLQRIASGANVRRYRRQFLVNQPPSRADMLRKVPLLI